MNKKLVTLFILVPLVFITIVLGFDLIKQKSKNNVLSAQVDQTPLATEPKLEIYNYNVSVQYPTSNEWIPAQDKQDLAPGTKIKTDKGGVAQIIYPNGTVTRLNSDTQITLDYELSPQKVTIFVEAGTIWSRITKLLGGESYQSESKNLVATVRGTIYEHTVLPTGEDKVWVESHTVHVKCGKDQEELDVNENESTKTNCIYKPVTAPIPQIEKETKWVTFNKVEDKKLKERFKHAKYDEGDDEGSTPTPSPSTLGIQTTAPSPTPRPTPTPTPTPTPLPLSITGVKLICSATGSARSIPQVSACGSGDTKIEVDGTGFTTGVKVYAIPVQQYLTNGSTAPILSDYNPDSKQGDIWPEIGSDGNRMTAHFSSAIGGTYYVRISLNSQIVDTNATFTSY